jgi:hypothetical protein
LVALHCYFTARIFMYLILATASRRVTFQYLQLGKPPKPVWFSLSTALH